MTSTDAIAFMETKLAAKQARLTAYYNRESFMLSAEGAQSYGIGSRNKTLFNTDLSRIQAMIKILEREIAELQTLITGRRPRRVVGVIPQDF